MFPCRCLWAGRQNYRCHPAQVSTVHSRGLSHFVTLEGVEGVVYAFSKTFCRLSGGTHLMWSDGLWVTTHDYMWLDVTRWTSGDHPWPHVTRWTLGYHMWPDGPLGPCHSRSTLQIGWKLQPRMGGDIGTWTAVQVHFVRLITSSNTFLGICFDMSGIVQYPACSTEFV